MYLFHTCVHTDGSRSRDEQTPAKPGRRARYKKNRKYNPPPPQIHYISPILWRNVPIPTSATTSYKLHITQHAYLTITVYKTFNTVHVKKKIQDGSSHSRPVEVLALLSRHWCSLVIFLLVAFHGPRHRSFP